MRGALTNTTKTTKMTKISFAKVGANTAPEASASTTTASASTDQPTITIAPENLPVSVRTASVAIGSGDSLDNEGIDISDVKLPRLKLLQGTSDKQLLATFGFGSLLLKDDIAIARAALQGNPAQTARMLFVRLISKTYTERVARYGDPSMFARSLPR